MREYECAHEISRIHPNAVLISFMSPKSWDLQLYHQINKLAAIVAATTDIYIFPLTIKSAVLPLMIPLPVAPSCRRCHVGESTTVVTPHLPPHTVHFHSFSKVTFFLEKNAEMYVEENFFRR